MDIFAMGRCLRRRWLLVAALLLATFGLAWAAQAFAPDVFEAHGSVVLEPPTASADVPRSLDLVEVAEDLREDPDGELPAFTLSRQASADSYRLATAGPDATAARDAASRVVDRLIEKVEGVQSGAWVPELERVDVIETSPRAVSEAADDGSVVIVAALALRDPAEVRTSPFEADETAGRRISVAVTADAARQSFNEEVGSEAAYTVTQEPGDPIPLLDVVTTAPDPRQADAAFDVVVSLLEGELRSQQEQAGVLARQQVTLAILEQPQGADYRSPPVKRATALVLLLGGISVVVVPITLEHRRRPRRHESDQPASAATSGLRESPDPVMWGKVSP